MWSGSKNSNLLDRFTVVVPFCLEFIKCKDTILMFLFVQKVYSGSYCFLQFLDIWGFFFFPF